MTTLKVPEYICIHIRDIPEDIIKEYKLKEKTDTKGAVYIVSNRGMYGLPQSRLLDNELLEKRLNRRGYQKIKFVPGLWEQNWQSIQFTLVVDNFGVNYMGDLKQILEKIKKSQQSGMAKYTSESRWTGIINGDKFICHCQDTPKNH